MTTQAELENNVFTIKLQTQQFFRRNGLDGLVVRVEGQTDELFWRPLLEIVLPNKAFQFFPYFDEASGTTGKPDVVKYIGFGDKQLIFCIDSDTDYLLENPILQTPFVFHTYIDMIENHWCFAKGLSEVFNKTTDSESNTFDFVHFFELGLTEQNAYLFFRGKNLLPSIFMPLMVHLGRDFDKARIKALSSNQEKAAFQENRKPYLFDIVAQNNPKMLENPFYQRIIHDIQMAFQN
jgi:Protein of unknown function (DUF4435)